jgi:uncharacterized protein (TIGR02145 family)
LTTDGEWRILKNYAGGDGNAAAALKARGLDGDDKFGFSALSGGFRDDDGDFKFIGNTGYWWSATEEDSKTAYRRLMNSGDATVYRFDYSKKHSFSVRLVRD